MSMGALSGSNKPGAGNAGGLGVPSSMSSRRVFEVAGGGGAGEFSGSAAAWWAGSGSAMAWSWIGAGHGILRVSGASMGKVRTAKSEWGPQVVDRARFSGSAVQPDRLNSAAPAFGRGVRPPRRRRAFPIPVASGGYRIGEKSIEAARSAANAACQAEIGRPGGRGVLQALLGSGVRAAPSAGVNGQSGCRPISRRNSRKTVGSGVGFALSCACGVNELATLESAGGRVN